MRYSSGEAGWDRDRDILRTWCTFQCARSSDARFRLLQHLVTCDKCWQEVREVLVQLVVPLGHPEARELLISTSSRERN